MDLQKSLCLPKVMGILNVTPDSFSDGGLFMSRETILNQVEKMVSEGVDIVDIGGESTRPGAKSVSLQLELDRVLPAVEWVKSVCDLPISIDTYKPLVMSESIALGVEIINDINALQAEGAVKVVAEAGVQVCLMHKQGQVQTMQQSPEYDDVVQEVSIFLQDRVDACINAGVQKQKIILDPGFGFGKTLVHNVQLFRSLDSLVSTGFPVLVGVSRKKMIGALLGDETQNRVMGSVSASVIAMLKGVRYLRVHDVAETVQALKVASVLGRG